MGAQDPGAKAAEGDGMLSRALWSVALSLPVVVGCAAPSGDDSSGGGGDGKADSAAVSDVLEELTKDGELSADDVDALFDAAGNTVNRSEMLVIRDATESTDFEVPADAKTHALERANYANLFAPEAAELKAKGGYGGNSVPAAVRTLLAKARLNGAVAFDVREVDSTGEGIWNPYPTTTPPTENMTFKHTVITPQGLAADLANTTVEYNAITGTEMVTENGQTYEQVTYMRRKGGTGNITEQYDHAYHPDIYARGSNNQIWSSNCAFLSDGTIHCLPAARRSEAQDLILTNPHLSRCSEEPAFADDCHTLMYLGHITASRGVITSVEISGRLSKEISKGRVNVIDPLTLFSAWGFQTSPGLSITFGNSEDGRPVRNEERGVVEQAQP
jgi:hypothetical protein